MGASVDRTAARLRRLRLIEVLNAKEAELPKPAGGRTQLSESELAFEIEKERQRNFSRVGFSQII
jgi:hypothetical protein